MIALSMYMNSVPGAYVQTNSRCILTYIGVITAALSIQLFTLACFISGVVTSKAKCFKVLKYWILVGLCLLLVRQSRASDSSEIDDLSGDSAGTGWTYSSADSESYKSTCEESDKMIALLKSFGFSFNNSVARVIPYKTSNSQKLSADAEIIPAPDPSSVLSNVPIYIVDSVHGILRFEMPNNSTEEECQTILNSLRQIAFIRASAIAVVYKPEDMSQHQKKLEILSRVVNMVECNTLEISIGDNIINSSLFSQIDLDACWEEAHNTFVYANYELPCCINFSAIMNNSIANLVDSGVALLRPLRQASLCCREFPNAHLLNLLPLINEYRLIFKIETDDVSIDMKTLLSKPPQCSNITIIGADSAKLSLTGMENAIANYEKISLCIPWKILQSLIQSNNSLIHVYSIVGLNIDPETITKNIMVGNTHLPLKPRVFARQIPIRIAKSLPCNAQEYYKMIYTQDAFNSHGISVDEIHIYYDIDRHDMHSTLSMLNKIDAISEIPKDVSNFSVKCTGMKLSNPKWQLQEAVSIQLNNPKIPPELTNYRTQGHTFFCQNIHYNEIHIKGGHGPWRLLYNRCIHFLDLFQSIKARMLKISDLRMQKDSKTIFTIDVLLRKLKKKRTKNLNIHMLILDNVDVSIIYRMLARYNLVHLVDMRILNQNFNDLGIAQTLSLPTSGQIKSLMVNDFLSLNEVAHYKNQESVEGFLLFRYVEAIKQANLTPKDCGLHRLVLEPTNINHSAYKNVLSEFWRFGIQIRSISFKEYLNLISSNKQYSQTCQQELGLWCSSLTAIRSDLSNYQAKNPTSFNPTQPPRLVIPRKLVKHLLINFEDEEILTEASLIAILRWISYRFKEVITIQLDNLFVSESVRRDLVTRNYWVVFLNKLHTIQIRNTTIGFSTSSISIPEETKQITILAQSYQDNLLVHHPNSTAEFIVIPSNKLFQLITQQTPLDDLIPKHLLPKEPIQMIKANIKRLDAKQSCSVCLVYLNRSGSSQGDRPPSKRFFQPNPILTTTTSFYFKCGHTTCLACAITILASKHQKCPTCDRSSECKALYQLISYPPSNFIFTEGYANNPTAITSWLNDQAWNDGQVYFHIAYKNIHKLSLDLGRKPSHLIHII
ncbi:hypothetical protein NEHOM01_0264 [Nematocida homosporus]|uniref:uncharacterized protein n=1 Tax=Nematocida homosporus TaxID=1912981 RepID=UPI0022205488|nr:uncharacterized protein NEHOM01_0264 [Nematocida homosporus]KAI5184589.1 hypothetical protein NEHOM01_0264 [Nematocida homosporus]